MNEMAIDTNLIVDYATPWANLTTGNIVQSTIAPFTFIFGGWFYVLIIFLGLMFVYMKTQDFGTTIVTGLIVSAGFLPVAVTLTGISSIYSIIWGMVVLALAGMLYKIFKK